MRYTGHFEVVGKNGLHAMPSTFLFEQIDKVRETYKVSIKIHYNGAEISNIIDLLSRGIEKGRVIGVEIDGERNVSEAFYDLLNRCKKLNEEELFRERVKE
jgi:phosphotransferase system HPr-like phosphotransfer protein